MTDEMYDVAILGGGHNGLVTGAYLAGAGKSVIVLEKNRVVGGAAVTEEFHPGFRNSVASYTVSLLHPKIIADLELARHGLRIVERPVANFWPIDRQHFLLMPYGLEKRQAAIAAFSASDAARLPAYDAALERAASVLRGMLLKTPPNAGGGIADLIRGIGAGWGMARLPLGDQRLLVDLFTKSASSFLDGWFENDHVKASFAFDGIVGTFASPHTPGTAYVLLHHCFGGVNGKSGVWGHAIGGMGAITQAMARAAAERGAVIRTDAEVERLLHDDDRTTGVQLTDGQIIRARAVASNVAPKALLRSFLAPGLAPPRQPQAADADPPGAAPNRGDPVAPDVREAFARIETGSGTFRMNVALSELPDFTCLPGTRQQPHHGAGIVIGPTIGYLDRAYLDARRDGWSAEPVVEMLIPSTLDDGLAPPGGHVASLFVQHVQPRLPDGRSWANRAEAERFADVVIDTVSRHAPNFKASILGRQILSPLDLEARFGLLDGDIFHGQLGLGQLFSARPVLGFADYRGPLRGLYFCGSGAHPGGGVTGVPGHNAAREILKDFKRRRL